MGSSLVASCLAVPQSWASLLGFLPYESLLLTLPVPQMELEEQIREKKQRKEHEVAAQRMQDAAQAAALAEAGPAFAPQQGRRRGGGGDPDGQSHANPRGATNRQVPDVPPSPAAYSTSAAAGPSSAVAAMLGADQQRKMFDPSQIPGLAGGAAPSPTAYSHLKVSVPMASASSPGADGASPGPYVSPGANGSPGTLHCSR